MDQYPTPPAVELSHITVRFAENGVVANRNVSVSLYGGETVGIIGENGAGKSTLMNVMAGAVMPSEGEISVHGSPCRFENPSEALLHGIAMVHQHPRIVRNISSWENAILGIEPGWWVRRSEARRMFLDIANRYGLHVNPGQSAQNLSSHEAFDLALLSALLRKPKILLLDEPVTTFTKAGIQDIHRIIDILNDEGIAVGYISHKIDEILDVCSRIVVMRMGEIVGSVAVSDADAHSLASMMLGDNASEISLPQPVLPDRSKTGDVVLSLDSVTMEDPTAGTIGPISFQVSSGECLAITGMRDRGITAIEELLSGHLPPKTGSVTFMGEQFALNTPHALRSRGIAYIPTDRLIRGASLQSTLSENLILLTYRKLQRWGLFKTQEIREFSGHLKGAFGISGETTQDLNTLSGGNIQKTILSRELEGNPHLVILSEPSRGLNILSRQIVYRRIRALCEQGSAVIVITTDIEEAHILGGRFAVMYGPEFISIADSTELSRDDLGSIAFGAQRHLE